MIIIDGLREHFHVDDLYQVLKVPSDCNQDEIKKAYFRRSLELHPDKATDSSRANELKIKFQILSEVYKILSDTKSREKYDSQFIFSRNRSINTNSTIYEIIPLRECAELEDSYCYDCRCSGQFNLSKQCIDDVRDNSIERRLPDQELSFIVDCDTCSNSIKIVL